MTVASPPAWRFAVDRGGTFTDVVATTPDGRLVTAKLLSENPGHYADAASEAVRRLMAEHGEGPVAELRIGTTVATNALLERNGERLALAITRGFGDALRIGTQARPHIFARHIVLPEQLSARVVEIAERVAVDGTVLRPLDEVAARAAFAQLRNEGFDALAIVLMHGWQHRDHEARLAAVAREAGFAQVSVSHEVAPLIRLIPRGDTTVVDAYLSPVLRRYTDRLAASLPETGALRFMQSNGGLAEVGAFRGKDAILSGPSGGVVGMVAACEPLGYRRLIGFDIAILDRSGTLGLIENSGTIAATGADSTSTRNIAIDLSARTGDSIVRQTAVAAGVSAPTITGDIRFGGGSDLLELADGGFAGNVSFGAGTNRLVMSGDALMNGNADFGGGAGTLSLAGTAAYAGRLLNAQNVAVTIGGGSLALIGPTSIASLDVGANGVIGATLGGTAGTSTAITVSGAASFGTGAKIRIRLADINTAVGTYTVISAGSLTGANNLAADSALVPFLYKAALAVSGNNINVAISRKANTELGLNASEAAAFDGLFAAFSKDIKVADLFLGINTAAVFQAYVAQTLPDHAGGSFEGISQGLRAFDRHFMDPNSPFDEEGSFRIIADFANWNVEKDRGQTAAFDLSGLGFRGGAEYLTRFGAFGVTGSWLWNKHKNGPFDNSVLSDSYEAGAHWRGKFGPVIAFARAGAGKADFSGSRVFAGSGTGAANYTITRAWKGDFVTATGGASIEGGGQFFFFRPSVVVDYLRLKEDGYTEAGGGTALNLTVADRASKEIGINGAVAVGADLFGMQARDRGWLRIEAEGGWRELLTSELGATRARYNTGTLFTLTPEARDSGWFARTRVLGGDGSYKIAGELGLEEQFGNIGYALRASIRIGW